MTVRSDLHVMLVISNHLLGYANFSRRTLALENSLNQEISYTSIWDGLRLCQQNNQQNDCLKCLNLKEFWPNDDYPESVWKIWKFHLEAGRVYGSTINWVTSKCCYHLINIISHFQEDNVIQQQGRQHKWKEHYQVSDGDPIRLLHGRYSHVVLENNPHSQ